MASKKTESATSAIIRLHGAGSVEQLHKMADLMEKRTGIRPSVSALVRLAIQRLYEAQMKGLA